MTKNILVIYYSQTNQTRELLDSILAPILMDSEYNVEVQQINPVVPYPFPWSRKGFFDVFPETVLGIPIELHDLAIKMKNYDLVLFGYQPWYLSPSLPIRSFLKSQQAATILKNSKVISVIDCRNMWIQCHQDVNSLLKKCSANNIGSIVFSTEQGNIKSVFSTMRWMFTGVKGNAGVSTRAIQEASKFGIIIKENLDRHDNITQSKLNSAGAIKIDDSLMLLEQQAKKIFIKMAGFIRKAGPPGSKGRPGRLLVFRLMLMSLIIPMSIYAKFKAICYRKFFPKKDWSSDEAIKMERKESSDNS